MLRRKLLVILGSLVGMLAIVLVVAVWLLQDVMESFARKLTIQLDIDQLHEQRITMLQETLGAFKGSHPLSFVVYEMQEEIKVNLSSRKQKVQISSELLEQLTAQEIHYKLN